MHLVAPGGSRLTAWSATVRHRPVTVWRRGERTPMVPGTGPRVLLLHGMANSSTVWDAVHALAPHREALRAAELWLAELPWRGGGLADWSYQTDASVWVAEVLDAMRNAAGRADVVVAHSYAATALLELLCREATQAAGLATRSDIRGVVFVSPFFRSRPEDFGWDTVAGLGGSFVRTMEEGIRVVAGQRGNPAIRRAMAERLCEQIGPYGWMRFLELYLRTPWLRTDLLRVPSLVVAGAEDTVATVAESEALARRLPSAALHPIGDCGHFPMIERAEQFADALDTFITRAGVSWSDTE